MISRKNKTIVRVSEGPSGVYVFVLLSADIEDLPTVADGVMTGSVALVQDTQKILVYHEDNGWEEWEGSGGGYPEPTGTKSITITENGVTIEDVKDVASAQITVEVSGGGSSVETDILGGTLSGSYSNADLTRGLKQYVLNYNANLESISLPNCTSIGDNALNNCSGLKRASFPSAESLGTQAMRYCGRNLAADEFLEVDLSSCTFLGQNCLSNAAVQVLRLPSLTDIGTNAVSNSRLEYLDCSRDAADGNPRIQAQGLNNATNLRVLALRDTHHVWQLNYTSAFNGTPIASGTGYIYVPAALLETYKTATNWSTYAAQFRALEDYTKDGTVTGELDWENL